MSKRKKYLEMISAYADDELNETEKAELEAHLENCEECRSVLEMYREMSAEMLSSAEEVPEGFSDGVMEKVASYEKNISAKIAATICFDLITTLYSNVCLISSFLSHSSAAEILTETASEVNVRSI